jgi:hypothetical protein
MFRPLVPVTLAGRARDTRAGPVHQEEEDGWRKGVSDERCRFRSDRCPAAQGKATGSCRAGRRRRLGAGGHDVGPVGARWRGPSNLARCFDLLVDCPAGRATAPAGDSGGVGRRAGRRADPPRGHRLAPGATGTGNGEGRERRMVRSDVLCPAPADPVGRYLDRWTGQGPRPPLRRAIPLAGPRSERGGGDPTGLVSDQNATDPYGGFLELSGASSWTSIRGIRSEGGTS